MKCEGCGKDTSELIRIYIPQWTWAGTANFWCRPCLDSAREALAAHPAADDGAEPAEERARCVRIVRENLPRYIEAIACGADNGTVVKALVSDIEGDHPAADADAEQLKHALERIRDFNQHAGPRLDYAQEAFLDMKEIARAALAAHPAAADAEGRFMLGCQIGAMTARAADAHHAAAADAEPKCHECKGEGSIPTGTFPRASDVWATCWKCGGTGKPAKT